MELKPQQQVQVLRYLCDQHFDNEHVLEVYDDHQASLAQLRKDKVGAMSWHASFVPSAVQLLLLWSLCAITSQHGMPSHCAFSLAVSHCALTSVSLAVSSYKAARRRPSGTQGQGRRGEPRELAQHGWRLGGDCAETVETGDS